MDFEKVFGIPADHTLSQKSFRQKGALAQDDHWEHEEVDAEGNVIARYMGWACTSIKPPFKTTTGYRKYDPHGNLINES